MDPLDHGRARLDGLTCAVCDGAVPPRSVQLLARREGLTFVQVECAACSSTSLAFLIDGGPLAEGAAEGERIAPDAAVDADDLLDMHLLLRDWRGGLRELVGGARRMAGSRLGERPASTRSA